MKGNFRFKKFYTRKEIYLCVENCILIWSTHVLSIGLRSCRYLF